MEKNKGRLLCSQNKLLVNGKIYDEGMFRANVIEIEIKTSKEKYIYINAAMAKDVMT